MNKKTVISLSIIVIGIVIGAVNFFNSNVEYGNFGDAKRTHGKIQVKGEWVKDRESGFNVEKAQFTFFLKDETGEIYKVVLDGAKPNNFYLAPSVVVKGKMAEDYFQASEVLTKCPEKYEGKTGLMKKQF